MTVGETDMVHAWLDAYQEQQERLADELKRG